LPAAKCVTQHLRGCVDEEEWRASTGTGNDAFGTNALLGNSTGNFNNAFGTGALGSLASGSGNVAFGRGADFALTTGSADVYIGDDVVGQNAEDAHTYIRNINTTSVNGGGTDTVTVNLSTGLLGHLSSSRRYKEDIEPMGEASEALY
jgi:hypothetical protein